MGQPVEFKAGVLSFGCLCFPYGRDRPRHGDEGEIGQAAIFPQAASRHQKIH